MDTFKFCLIWHLTNFVKGLLAEYSTSETRCWEISICVCNLKASLILPSGKKEGKFMPETLRQFKKFSA